MLLRLNLEPVLVYFLEGNKQMRRKLLGKRDYILPTDEAIDFEKWHPTDTDGNTDFSIMSRYFIDDYTLPPIKKGETPLIFKIQQLTPAQLDDLTTMQYASEFSGKPAISHDWQKFIVQYGVAGWSGLEVENEKGEISIIKPEFIETPLGQALSEKSYQELLPFFTVEILALTMQIKSYSVR